jgi:hypothetical protein
MKCVLNKFQLESIVESSESEKAENNFVWREYHDDDDMRYDIERRY